MNNERQKDLGPRNFPEGDGRFSPMQKDTIQYLTFFAAMIAVSKGKAVRRLEWTNPESRTRLVDDILSIYTSGDNKYHPLYITTADMLGEDWVVVEQYDNELILVEKVI